jgi:hypothetical protein
MGSKVRPIFKASSPLTLVPRCWPGSTIVCLASGPSLCQADVDACRDVAHVIAIKDSVRLAPWADVMYACDRKYWLAHPETEAFPGPKYGLESVAGRPDVQVLRIAGTLGLETRPSGLCTGHNSGYQAINLAVHLGAARIVLLGYDMQPQGVTHHWFGAHAYNKKHPPYKVFLAHFPYLVAPLQQLGVSVINATRRTVLETFPRQPLLEALHGRAA